ncbi:hypothetical protein [Liquorilactobacillus hordei]|uniref:hypothetical protein n=1 Tax=Liquorilactobacillus hordei TaxID=468911 RepID=UPI0039E8618A
MTKKINLEDMRAKLEQVDNLVEITNDILDGMSKSVADFKNEPSKGAGMAAYAISSQHHLLVGLQSINTDFLLEIEKDLDNFISHYYHSGQSKILKIEVEESESNGDN